MAGSGLLSGFNTYMQARLDGRTPDWHWVLFNSIDWLHYALLTPCVLAQDAYIIGRTTAKPVGVGTVDLYTGEARDARAQEIR